jgi:NADP-reducing hydrogenase subunit HndB
MKNLDELRKLRDEARQVLNQRGGKQRVRVTVCMGTCGIVAGARVTMRAFMDELAAASLGDVAVMAAGCAGCCEKEPMVEIAIKDEKPVRYGHVDPAAVRRIVREHLIQGKMVSDLMFA